MLHHDWLKMDKVISKRVEIVTRTRTAFNCRLRHAAKEASKRGRFRSVQYQMYVIHIKNNNGAFMTSSTTFSHSKHFLKNYFTQRYEEEKKNTGKKGNEH